MSRPPEKRRADRQRTYEEERTFGVRFEHARALVPRLLERAVGTKVDTLEDAYFVARADRTTAVTVRLGRAEADTRCLVRVTSLHDSHTLVAGSILLMTFVGMAMELSTGYFSLARSHWFRMLVMMAGALAVAYAARSAQQKQAVARDVLAHKIFRTIEDAVASQSVMGHYRVAPGTYASLAEDAALLEEEAQVPSAAAARARA
jgi:hypothetical protein